MSDECYDCEGQYEGKIEQLKKENKRKLELLNDISVIVDEPQALTTMKYKLLHKLVEIKKELRYEIETSLKDNT